MSCIHYFFFLLHSLALGSTCCGDSPCGFGMNLVRLHKHLNSSSNSITSSISSVSSTSSESAAGGGDLEADADSLACRQSGLSSNSQFQKDGLKMVRHTWLCFWACFFALLFFFYSFFVSFFFLLESYN